MGTLCTLLMPQLDTWTYLGQVTFTTASLLAVYYGSKAFLLPSLAVSLKSPVKLQRALGNQSASLGDELAYTKSV